MIVLLVAFLALCLAAVYVFYPWLHTRLTRTRRLIQWFSNPGNYPDWTVQAGSVCGEAPFMIPTDGYIGFVWGDSFRPGHRHQGIDIFAGLPAGKAPVVAAYAGYLTRLPDWKSSLIIRIPEDPLQPGRQIWTYYTHMADDQGNSNILPEFPAGTTEKYVASGTLLGYQGNYSGDPFNPVGVHLHFSIVLDRDGRFLNELDIRNTLDPSRYLGLNLNADSLTDDILVCQEQ